MEKPSLAPPPAAWKETVGGERPETPRLGSALYSTVLKNDENCVRGRVFSALASRGVSGLAVTVTLTKAL